MWVNISLLLYVALINRYLHLCVASVHALKCMQLISPVTSLNKIICYAKKKNSVKMVMLRLQDARKQWLCPLCGGCWTSLSTLKH